MRFMLKKIVNGLKLPMTHCLKTISKILLVKFLEKCLNFKFKTIYFKIKSIENEKENKNQILLKFEPFILHVCCRTLGHAKQMVFFLRKN